MSEPFSDLESNLPAEDGIQVKRSPLANAVRKGTAFLKFSKRLQNASDDIENRSLVSSPSTADDVQHRESTKIHCYAFSASGHYVSTLSFSDNRACIRLWDIKSLTRNEMKEDRETKKKTSVTLSLGTTTTTSSPTVGPIATHWFPFLTQALETERDTTTSADIANGFLPGPRMSVSWDGSQFAVYSTGPSDNAHDGKFHMFITEHTCTSDGNSVLTLIAHPVQCKLREDLRQFRGYAKFVYTGPDDKPLHVEDERFIVCDGQCVSVYATTVYTGKEDWKKLYSIPLLGHPKLQSVQWKSEPPSLANLHFAKANMEVHPADKEKLGQLIENRSRLARFACESAQGEYFLWQKGWNVFVWHLGHGSNVSCISLGLGILEKNGLTSKDMKSGPPKKVQFLYSDGDTIALRVVVAGRLNMDMAILFSAKTGRELAPFSVSLSDPVGDGHDGMTLADVLARFDGSANGSTLRMPVLQDTDIRNTLGVVIRGSPPSYGVHQRSPTEPSFIILRRDSELKISRMQATSTKSAQESNICPANCGGTKPPLTNDPNEKIVKAPEGSYFVIKIWNDTAKKDSEGNTQKLLDVRLKEKQENIYLRLEMDGSESIKVFEDSWILTVQGPVSLSIWRLPPRTDGVCQLMLHWAGFPVGSFSNEELSVEMCSHSPKVRFEHKLYEKSPVLIPIEISRASSDENADVFIAGVQDIAKRFTSKTDSVTRKAVFLYLRAHLHGTPGRSAENRNNINDELHDVNDFGLVNDLVLCQFRGERGWTPREAQCYDNQFAEKMIRWYSSKMKDGKRNYFYLLLEFLPSVVKKSEDQWTLESILLDVIDWCFIQASEKGRPEELRHLIISIPELLTMRPRLARKITRLFAYFLARDRQAIIDNLNIINPPVLKRVFELGPIRLEECKNLILQFRYDPSEPDRCREYFTESVFVAPISLLWSVEMPKSKFNGDFQESTLQATSGTSKLKERRPMNPDHDFVMVRTSKKTTLWKSLRYLVFIQFFPRLHIYVRPRYYHLSLLDNPAIEALVEYKWNTFGYLLWSVRFFAQCGYYLLIVAAALSQIYSEDPTVLYYTFVAIIIMASWFLWHEFWQFVSSVLELMEIRKSAMFRSSKWYKRQYVPRYLRSQYNWLDLSAFTFPLVASIHQLININEGNPDRGVWLLSFSLVIIFLHMVAELRVFRIVCKYVTIILRIISEIKVFFAVFALGLLYFSLAIEHVLRGRASGDYRVRVPSNDSDISNSPNPDGLEFPRNFFGAIASTYFIMGGRYDPINEELKSGENWALQIMIVIYFFFTVILMLNVLIALINGGFEKADIDWHLVWIENRLRYVESAENMSYCVPGFRETYDWFPREIYYTATKEQVARYNDRMPKDEGKGDSGEIAGDSDVPKTDSVSSTEQDLSEKFEIEKRLGNLLREFQGKLTSAPGVESRRHSTINQRSGSEQDQHAVHNPAVQKLQEQVDTLASKQDTILKLLEKMAAARSDSSASE